MRIDRRRWAALCALALLCAACGKQRAADQTAPATPSPAAASAATPVAPSTVAQQKPAGEAPVETSKITRMNEDGSETVEDTTGDSGTHNALLAAVAQSAAAAATNPPNPWAEGVNYTRIVPAQPTSVGPGQVEVLEMFWYACPHCYALDPLIETWRKSKPAYIGFSRVPVMWGEGHRSLARLFYTLQSLGKLDELHSAIFKEIHVGGNPLVDVGNNEARSEEIQTDFVTKFGVSADAFKSAYHSFTVETDLQRADQLTQRYRIAGVPTFIINGKYVADVGTAQGEERLIELISYLAAQEHKH
jgi:thiol:disulfide interchange protein DsbA